MIRRCFTTLLATLAMAFSLGAAAAPEANQATAAELEAVKGIGPAMSARITSARQQGPFKSWADLLDRVSGLGPGNAAKLSQAGLTVAGAGYVPAAATPAKPAGEKKPEPSADGKKAAAKP